MVRLKWEMEHGRGGNYWEGNGERWIEGVKENNFGIGL